MDGTKAVVDFDHLNLQLAEISRGVMMPNLIFGGKNCGAILTLVPKLGAWSLGQMG
jgi:hypothetical protein